MTETTTPEKKGLLTSELWIAIISGFGIIAWAQTDDAWQVRTAAVVAVAYWVGQFISGRSKVKAARVGNGK